MGAIAYISHGGGPLPLLGDPGHKALVEALQQLALRVGRPTAIVVISAHWEAAQATVTAAARPALIYDYHGFPAAAYEIRYPAPGAPELALGIVDTLNAAGITARPDAARGLDHGVFVPLKIMYPDAAIPCLQVSLLDSLDPAAHLRLGAALAAVDRPDLLFLGSGFSFHNLPAFFSPATPASQTANLAFEAWLHETCCSTSLDEDARERRLRDWAEAPGARFCHPRAEHLLPLHCCYGVARRPASFALRHPVMGRQASLYLWQ